MVNKKHCLTTFFIAIVLLNLAACSSMQNYRFQDEPLFSGDHVQGLPAFDEEIKAVTWNIRFSENIDQAITELDMVEELRSADILLLQEMDEAGVETIAKRKNYNYVYFPASIHTHHNKNFGNAILSPWPLSSPAKLILPYQNPKNNQIRIAVKSLVTINEIEVLVYSIHTETVWLGEQKRHEQIETLLNDIHEEYDYVIAGGDFNTFTAASILTLEEQFAAFGLKRVSGGATPTFENSNFSFTLDHIFAKGFSVSNNGVWRNTEASDHFPVWTNLSFE